MTVTDVNVVKSAIFERPDDANKGTLGSLLCVCGSYGMAGAAVMSAKGALRTGIGLAKCALPRSIYPIVAQTILESVYYPLSENADGRISKVNVPFLVSESCKSSATLVGCGLGVCDDTLKIVFSLIENSTTPLVLDADALNCVAKQPEILLRKKVPIIITPHPGEMSRLTGLATPLVNAERERVALDFAQRSRNGNCLAKRQGACEPDRQFGNGNRRQRRCARRNDRINPCTGRKCVFVSRSGSISSRFCGRHCRRKMRQNLNAPHRPDKLHPTCI